MEESTEKKDQTRQLSALLVGDELGLLRRLELDSQGQTARIRTINRDSLIRPSPEHAILTIRRFDSDLPKSPGYQHPNHDHLLLIASRDRKLHLYDPITDRLHSFETNRPDGQVVGAAPFASNHVIICYADGAIHVQNVERELIQMSADQGENGKALKVLGFDAEKGLSLVLLNRF
jgi:hypothetical protein